MHRQLLKLADPTTHVDHISGDTLDNRDENLRPCSHTENSRNRRKESKHNPTGYIGVTHNLGSTGKPYRVRIKVAGKVISLGYADTPEEGAARYKQAAKIYFGEFASTS